MDERKHYISVEKYCIDNLYRDQTEDKLSIDRLKKELKVKITSLNGKDIAFEMIGTDAIFPNSIRQVAWGEISTMAIDRIDVTKNTTPINEETLMELMSYVTFDLDAKHFESRKEDEEPTSDNAVMFTFNAKNTTSTRINIFANQFKWVPIGSQSFPDNKVPKPIDPDQFLMTLEPSQEISFKAYCFQGKGVTNAKFSPTPFVRCVMAPVTVLKRQFTGQEAHRLKELLPSGVIKIKSKQGVDVARVSNLTDYELDRNIYSHDGFCNDVELFLNRRHFLVNFETTGVFHPKEIAVEAINVLKQKCQAIIAGLDEL